jgi:hypothetical protein
MSGKAGYRMRVARRRISVEIKGSAEDGGFPRLTEFLQQLEAIRTALKHTERILSGSEERTVYYRVVALKMESPATVVLEETPIRTADKKAKLSRVPITERFISTLRQIEKRATMPKSADLDALEAYRNVGTLLHRHVEQITLKSKGKVVSIGEEFNRHIDKIIGPDQVLEGSMTGVLLQINLHNTTRFEIYPPVGPTKVVCSFPPELKRDVINGIDHNVRVVGELRYKQWAPFPHAIFASGLEVFPPEEELPTIFDLRGIAKNGDGP